MTTSEVGNSTPVEACSNSWRRRRSDGGGGGGGNAAVIALLVSLVALLPLASSFGVSPPRRVSLLTRSDSSLSLKMSLQEPRQNNVNKVDRDVPLIGSERHGVTFLGKNENALVKTGVVLLAPRHEFHHFYRKAAIFIHAMGTDERDGVFLIRGLILDHPTPFTLGDLLPNENNTTCNDEKNPLVHKPVFRGGDKGGEGVILLHKRPELAHASELIENTGGNIYQGGWDAALEACANKSQQASLSVDDDFKVFFNYCEFTEAELENMLKETTSDEEGEDGWMSVQVHPDLVFSSDYDKNRGDAWARFRNAVAQMKCQDS